MMTREDCLNITVSIAFGLMLALAPTLRVIWPAMRHLVQTVVG